MRLFSRPPGTCGNLGRGVFNGPGLADLDLSLFKNTAVTERVNLQFRAEFFNVLNHANFGTPNATVFSNGAVESVGGPDHEHGDDVAADSVWPEADLLISGLLQRFEEAVLKTNGVPGWVCVGHPDPDDQVRVTLEYGGDEIDISRCHRMVALAPLTIAVGDAPFRSRLGTVLGGRGVPADGSVSGAGSLGGSEAAIVVKERGSADPILGHIKVRMTRELDVCGSRIALFEAGESRNYCVSRLRGAAIRSYETWKAARDRNPRTSE